MRLKFLLLYSTLSSLGHVPQSRWHVRVLKLSKEHAYKTKETRLSPIVMMGISVGSPG